MNYKTIAKDTSFEEDIKKSRFICQLKRVNSEEEAREFIAAIKKDYHKSNHSCSAMIIGQDSQIKRSSDDGEPSGTAGIPMLTVLEKQGLTNVVAVVTRYFGGIKLGAGGLIRAYSGVVAHALLQAGLVEVKEQEGIQLELSYPQYQTLANFLAQEGLQEQDTDFTDKVLTTIYVDPDKVEPTYSALVEFYQGKVSSRKAGHKIVQVPLDSNS
ncbi:YigZ family protein [Streptococcus sobrinus]|uniref:YigZ family protein n=2 Tax=Streptococcus sobrinus TaxID=1310 RepID=UPI0002D7D56C|nr:YigZ family protein [Streptococcus sobrinus]